MFRLAHRAFTLPAHLDDYDLARALFTIEEYQLAKHDTLIQQLVDAVQQTQDPASRLRYRNALVARVLPYALLHERHPFSVAPPGILSEGQLLLGVQVNDSTIQLPIDAHVLIVGPTGTGKSSLLQLLLDQLDAHPHN